MNVAQAKVPPLSSNLEALNFRYTPLAQIAGKIVPVSAEKMAENLAAEAARKAARAKAKADAKAAKAARAKPLPQVRVVIPPTAEALEQIERQRRAKAEQRIEQFVAKPIPEEVLQKGLEADLAEEAKRREEEAAQAKIFAEGYRADVFKTAMEISRRDIPLEAKVIILEEIGFNYRCDTKNGRDAEYHHFKSDVTFLLRGGAIGSASVTNRGHKPRGVELLTPAQIEERRIANAALREKGRMERKKTVVKTPKADKKAKKDDDKKSKRGGKQ